MFTNCFLHDDIYWHCTHSYNDDKVQKLECSAFDEESASKMIAVERLPL